MKDSITDMTEAQKRKNAPVYSGFMKYFPKAIMAIAECSMAGQEQHNPGKPLAWDRSKSGDELDSLARHMLEAGTVDTDGVRHSVKICWRALASLEKELEKELEEVIVYSQYEYPDDTRPGESVTLRTGYSTVTE